MSHQIYNCDYKTTAMSKKHFTKAIKNPNGTITLPADDLELILLCLCSQKFIGEAPPNGDAAAMGKSAYEKSQKEQQAFVDDVYHQAMDLISSSSNTNDASASLMGLLL